MVQFIIMVGFFVVAAVLMATALHFSNYKKGESGCCGGGHCSVDADGNKVHSCYSEKSDFVDGYKNNTLH